MDTNTEPHVDISYRDPNTGAEATWRVFMRPENVPPENIRKVNVFFHREKNGAVSCDWVHITDDRIRGGAVNWPFEVSSEA